jgi:hypothetical protein
MKRLPPTRAVCDEHKKRTVGCRACADRAARYQRQREYEAMHGLPRTYPSAPYVEMLGRLQANGWPGYILTGKVGWGNARYFSPCVISRRPKISASLAERIERAVVELKDFPGPSAITRRRAIAAGFKPYLDDDIDLPPVVDEVAVERALKGEHVPLTLQERTAAVHIAVERGLTVSRIAELLHVHNRSVLRVLDGSEFRPEGRPRKTAA